MQQTWTQSEKLKKLNLKTVLGARQTLLGERRRAMQEMRDRTADQDL